MPLATDIPFEVTGSRLQKIAQLRELLAEKFSQPAANCSDTAFATNVVSLDTAINGGLPKGAVTEITGSIGGSSLLIISLLQSSAKKGLYVALVDGRSSFDPAGIGECSLSRFLWVCCDNAQHAIKATDLLLRDGNLSLVILDLQLSPAKELRRIPTSIWYRLGQLVEPTLTVLLALTPKPIVSSARARIHLGRQWTLDAMRERRNTLLAGLDPQVSKRSRSLAPDEERQLQIA